MGKARLMDNTQAAAQLSRRRLVRSAAVAGAATMVAGGAVDAGSTTSAPNFQHGTTSVSAMVVRADHSSTFPGAMRIGLRVSIQGPDIDLRRIVLVVEPIAFASAETVIREVAVKLQTHVAALLAKRGYATNPEAIVVQLFGANL